MCGALCLTPEKTCSEYIVEDMQEGMQVVMDIALDAASGTFIDISKLAGDFLFPECEEW